MFREKNSKFTAIFFTEIFASLLAGWFLCNPASEILPNFPIIQKTGMLLISLGIVQIVGYVLYWSVYHKAYKGLKHAFVHARLLRDVKSALLDAGTGYVVQEFAGVEKVVKLPRIKITLSKDLTQGEVHIRNHIRYDTRMETVNISSALGKYITEQQYISDDNNWHIFEFEDSSINRQLQFNSYKEFTDYCKQYKDYTLFMDSKSHVTLTHMLLVGATGSGKTYALYSLILQMLNWSIKPICYFFDPKGSSLVSLGKKIAPERTAGNVEEIVVLLNDFYDKMQQRKEELESKLDEKLDADYKNWNMPPYILIFDEFSSFQSVVNTMDKKDRDRIAMQIRSLVFLGRQIGCHLWVVMQKSDSNDIPTAIRDNLIWKIVLGQATNTTLLTCFEQAADLPKRKFGQGQGLYSYQGITRQPQITSFPTLNFNILEAVTRHK